MPAPLIELSHALEKSNMRTLPTRPRNYRIMSLEDYLNLSDKNKEKIIRAKVIVPGLEDDAFAYVKVFYKSPVYEIGFD